MTRLKYTLITTSLISLLSACGGSSGSSEAPVDPAALPEIASGKAIDGYLVGATVYYDFNNNGQLDADEPSTITESGGDFIVRGELSSEQAECVDFTPLIVDVPVGAMDEDLGEVTEAYVLKYPPAFVFEADSRRTQTLVTPITTLLWDEIVSVYEEAMDEPYSCADVKDSSTNQSKLAKDMLTSANNLVRAFNVTEENLFSDYIASADAQMNGMAAKFMAAIRKGIQEGQALKNNYSAQALTQVTYYVGDSSDDKSHQEGDWYKKTMVRDGNYFERIIHKVDDSFNETALMRHIKKEEASEQGLTTGYFNTYSRSDSAKVNLTCNAREVIGFSTKKNDLWHELEMTSVLIPKNVTDQECMETRFVQSTEPTNIHLKTKRWDTAREFTQSLYTYRNADLPFPYLDYVGYTSEPAAYAEPMELFLALQSLPNTLNDMDSVADTVRWKHMKTYYEGETRYSEHYSSHPANVAGITDGTKPTRWRYIYYPDLTRSIECMTNGEWQVCGS